MLAEFLEAGKDMEHGSARVLAAGVVCDIAGSSTVLAEPLRDSASRLRFTRVDLVHIFPDGFGKIGEDSCLTGRMDLRKFSCGWLE
eukprot:2679727-Amphidinium_carterae.1